TTTEQRAGTGAVVGAGTGALIAAATGSSGRGVATGALIGGAAGALIGAATTPGMCRYRDAYGRIYEARC
ncbi:MAG: glycine zipper domain-containing protein, partial [Hoeflea sp.]|nr:glycine zipper domain-containing protein [Hoeflea sp.]